MPSSVKDVLYADVENIDFRSARKLKQKLDVSIDNLNTSQGETLASTKQDNPEIAPPSPDELIDFYAKLNSCNTKPVLFNLIPPYSQSQSRGTRYNFKAFSVSFFDFFAVLLPQPTIRQRTMIIFVKFRGNIVKIDHFYKDELLTALNI